MEERVLFWRTTTAAKDFESAFNDANVEFVEFASEDDFNAADDIVEIESGCICYNPECPKRRYQDGEGRVYARCLPEDVGGDVAEQISHFNDKDKAAALGDIREYLCNVGYYTADAEVISFSDAPGWWLTRCASKVSSCFDADEWRRVKEELEREIKLLEDEWECGA